MTSKDDALVKSMRHLADLLDDKPKPTVASAFADFFFGVVFWAPAVTIFEGFVLAQTWNWFAWPFTSIHLSLPEAIGLSVLITMLKGINTAPSRFDDMNPHARAMAFILLYGILLLTGWIAHHFI